MPDREGSHFVAGGEKRLGIIRYGREEMTKYERVAGNDIMPGDALMASEDGDGVAVFEHHDGDATKDLYVAVEARQRGMDAQTDEGYASGEDYVIAVRASGGGLHLRLADGENVEDGDALVVGTGGTFQAEVDEGAAAVVAHAGESLDLSAADEPALVKAEAE